MGLALDPNKAFDYVLVTDRQRPESERPTFRFRYLSARDYLRVDDAFSEAERSATEREYFEKMADGLRLCLVGWDNVVDADGKRVPFSPDEILGVFTTADLLELRKGLLQEMHATALEKKLSAFAALSPTGNSAK